MGFLTEAVSGGFEGRLDKSASIFVELLDGALESTSRSQLLNGGSTAAIASNAGVWEIFLFQMAEEISPSLDEAVRPVGLTASGIGLALNWKFGPPGYDLSAENFVGLTTSGGERVRVPLSPVHLRTHKTPTGDLLFSWMRRGRIGAGNWQGEDIPLGETSERYIIEVASQGGDVVRSATVLAPNWTHGAVAFAEDFTSPPSVLDITVRQLSELSGPGVAARRSIAIV